MKSPRFPVTVRRGSVATKVYRLARADGREVFTAAWYVGGIRQTKQFPSYAEAHAEASLKADQLAAGRVEAAGMSVSERDEYQAAKRVADGVPLFTIVKEWQRARALAGADILKACEAWSLRHGKQVPGRKTIADAIKEFTRAKREAGIDTDAGYARTLPRFEEKFGAQAISSVSEQALSQWLAQFEHPVTRNTHRKRIVALFRWCRKRGMLPLDTLTSAERTDAAREPRGEIGLVTPEELASAFRLVQEKAPHYVPALAIAAFCGLRRAEVHGQDWRDVDLERKILRVTAAKPNTPARRLVPIPDAAVEWLVGHRQKHGPICTNLAIDRIRDICRTAGLDLADNGFRHSWISARVIVTGNIPETAIEAGHSVQTLHAHYRELMRKDEASAWFDCRTGRVADAVVRSVAV